MKMRRIRSHPDFKLEGRSRFFQSFWELELTPGEETCPHQHYESEELIYLLSGRGTVRIDQTERGVKPGEIVLVPPRTDHIISNQSDCVVHAITVESQLGLSRAAEAPSEATASPESEEGEQAVEEGKRSADSIDKLLDALPSDVNEAVAIKSIVELFNIGGDLSEMVETTVGLDHPQALSAVRSIERKIMRAVVEISGRYQFTELQDGMGWPRG